MSGNSFNINNWCYNAVVIAWKVSKYKVFSGSYFPVFGPEKTLYLDTFHAISSEKIDKTF